jgi:hypothetical protein
VERRRLYEASEKEEREDFWGGKEAKCLVF